MNILQNMNNTLGRFFFNNSNTFSNNVYKLLYKKNICNLSYLKYDFIKSYYDNGYAKLGKLNQKYIDELNAKLIEQRPSNNENFSFKYEITPEIYRICKNLLNNDLKEKIQILENYYNQKIIFSFLTISRNYPSVKKSETYSNFFHTDGYVYNMFKIFVNLQDVKDQNGPLILVKKNKAKEFLKKYQFKDRYNYNFNSTENNDFFFKNTGKKGEMLLANTTELIHRAGDLLENNFRDMLFLHFVAYPKKKSSLFEYENEIFDDKLIKRFSKIKNIKSLLSFYNQNKKEKLVQ